MRQVCIFLSLSWAYQALVDFFRFKARTDQKATGRVYSAEITSWEKLITLKEMREQDGRCSSGTMTEYQRSVKGKPWGSLSPEEQDKYKFARLLSKGHEMICLVNLKAPHTIALISRIPVLNLLPPSWQYSVAGFGFALAWWSWPSSATAFISKTNLSWNPADLTWTWHLS